ncbi:hypothetical protein Lal_00021408 [Lupinus albus]|nr:hypothetical protein Lal_00021408 [Lupinus albus]
MLQLGTLSPQFSQESGTIGVWPLWYFNWFGETSVDQLGIPAEIETSLLATVADFRLHDKWIIPSCITRLYPELLWKIANNTCAGSLDRMVWQNTNDRFLSRRSAYATISQSTTSLNWCKLIWTKYIPPSKSFLIWRIFHNRLPNDENLAKKSIFSTALDTSSFNGLFKSCTHHSNPQVKELMMAGLVFTIYTVWFCINNLRFEDKKHSITQAFLV